MQQDGARFHLEDMCTTINNDIFSNNWPLQNLDFVGGFFYVMWHTSHVWSVFVCFVGEKALKDATIPYSTIEQACVGYVYGKTLNEIWFFKILVYIKMSVF